MGCEDLIKMLSILVRSSSTASFPPLNNIDGDDISGDGAEFEAKHFEYGFAPYFVADGNGSGRGRRIVLPQEDRLCIWKSLDSSLDEDNHQHQQQRHHPQSPQQQSQWKVP